MFKRKPSSNRAIETLIGAGTRIDGDLDFTGGLHVEGHIRGNVRGRGGPAAFLSVSQQGCIEGSVTAANVMLNGVVTGDIEASGRVELGANARVMGNVQYAVIESAVGAQINGKLIHRAAGTERPAGAEGLDSGTLIGRQPAG